MEGSSHCGESSDPFFDSAEHLSTSEEESDYGIWVKELKSVKERRENFLQGMGFGEFRGSSCPKGERLRESSGAVTSSWDIESDSVEESSVGSRSESGIDAHDLSHESEEYQENESSSSECRQGEEKEVKIGNGRKISRWWSFLAKRRSSLVADQPDYKEIHKSPMLSKLKVRCNQKRSKEFTGLYCGQEIQAHSGIIWTMKFSPDGKFLASGGSDGIVRVWKVSYADAHCCDLPASDGGKAKRDKFDSGRKSSYDSCVLIPEKVFCMDESPVQEFHGHTGDILDLAWSNTNLLLSSSMDKTVRLWNLGSKKSLDIFHHVNYVTCIQFHPVHENYFISGSIDGKVRVWGVSDRRVVDWADVRDVITAICYQPDGNGFVVGSIVGTCHFFDASGAHLHLDRIIDIQGRKKALNRVTSIQFSQENSRRVLITSEDGKIRVFDGLDIVQKYKGLPKSGSQLSASFSLREKLIVSVGDDSRVYLWNYDSSSVIPSKNKSVKSVRSCEYFLSEAVSVALPWSGTDRSLLGINSSKSLQCCSRRLGCPTEARDSDRFSIGNWFSIEGPCLGTPTWPEEKLPLWELSEGEEYDLQSSEEMESLCFQVPETWGLVLVTASFDGRIRTYHNYGLPMRL